MLPDTSGWRSSPNYDYIDHLSSPDVGWEWLRRNEDYQHDYVGFDRTTIPVDMLIRRVSQQWGLCFPCRSASSRQRDGGFLAP
ncbi:hypothetical protein FHS82_004052 [Pseudochelatococcus lubricantis]|uniref:Transcriptional regulator-like domain-containing protein n=1 Tax=Pseudochelatococcus lubricantis TaxID=1538102 RepID=A0ABX0V6Q3_9HYPH|nr:DUF6499 domain-containing protein [Pseudochelatococcus lubricantis]NIJ60185.1 hypothetical protein [Pseudochelatococcus lubricantis]